MHGSNPKQLKQEDKGDGITEITVADMKILYFGLIFMSVVGVFVVLYNQQPIESYTPLSSEVEGTQGISTSVLAPAWITELLSIPQPFADLVMVLAIFMVPVSILLSIVAIRYVKDLATQWI